MPWPPQHAITLTPYQVYALAMYAATGHAVKVGQPMFVVKPDCDPLDPDVSLRMENADALSPHRPS